MSPFPSDIRVIVDEARTADTAWQTAATARLNELVWWDVAFYGPYLLALLALAFSFGG